MGKPTEFKECNSVQLGYEQDDLKVADLPSWRNEQETISCWKLSWKERLFAMFTGKIWCRVLTYDNKLQPLEITGLSPFVKEHKKN